MHVSHYNNTVKILNVKRKFSEALIFFFFFLFKFQATLIILLYAFDLIRLGYLFEKLLEIIFTNVMDGNKNVMA